MQWIRPPHVRRLALVALVTAATLLAACGDDNTNKIADAGLGNPPTVTAGRKVNVVTTTTQVQDFVRVVGGDRVVITGLIKPNTDPHDFEPAPEDAVAISHADLVVKNGAGLESFLDKLLDQAGKNRPVADLSRGVTLRKGEGDEEKDGDPHIWFNPKNAEIMVDNLTAALSKIDPSSASVYRANADAYKKQLDDLDHRIQEQINAIPKDRRKMVTNHDAFGYYIDRYGLTFVGSVIPSLETNAEPSAREIADLIDKIKQEGVPAIFTEVSLNPKLEQQIAQQAGVKVVSNLYGDSLGEPGSPGDTYLGMMDYNTRTIVDALK
jgi:zinc/manganese transport system substrate-binding protein/manganese/iron transport system substrate-binding protein